MTQTPPSQVTASSPPRSLRGRTLFITGASRGIGLAIALRAARDGANIAVVAKTDTPHPKLPGTVHTACAAIEQAGGKALACVADVRDEVAIAQAVEQTVKKFGGLDILVNNASAISLTPTLSTAMKRFDLMHSVNARGTFVCAQAALPHLLKSEGAHILTLSPPLDLRPEWFGPHLAYSLSKYGMSLCTLGLANEHSKQAISVNSLWPKTIIATAAVENLLGGSSALARCRKPEIVADAAHTILTELAGEQTGQFLVDEEVLRSQGIVNFSSYAMDPNEELAPDLFI